MSRLVFDELKDDIIVALKEKIAKDVDDLSLIPGFINILLSPMLPTQGIQELSCLPSVAVLDKNSGRIHIFPLEYILPNLDFDNQKET